MAKIKFINFYESLSKKQRAEFRRFACSPYFNKGRSYLPVIDSINRICGKELSSKEVIKILSGELNSKSRTLWNRLSELMKMSEYFILTKYFEEDKTLFNNIISSYYVSNSMFNLFVQKNKSNIKSFNNSKINLKTFYNIFENKENEGFYDIYTNRHREYIFSLKEQVIYHSASFIIKHYLHLTELLQQQKIGMEQLESIGVTFLSDDDTIEFLENIKTNYNVLYKLAAFQFNIYKAFSDTNHEEYYAKAREISKQVMAKLNDDYKLYIYQLMVNYCINQTNRFIHKYYKELFEIYNEKLEQNLFQDLKVGNFPVNNFRDYIFVSLKLKKLDWAK
ncbi:MAG: hypothetical protein L0Y79_07240 [Chlorobi bacterium]|nr:hypothetical protein [Chlorobiota bacterium]MCI0716853.1 hypothetical protein [Chlorobiota bacterium]